MTSTFNPLTFVSTLENTKFEGMQVYLYERVTLYDQEPCHRYRFRDASRSLTFPRHTFPALAEVHISNDGQSLHLEGELTARGLAYLHNALLAAVRDPLDPASADSDGRPLRWDCPKCHKQQREPLLPTAEGVLCKACCDQRTKRLADREPTTQQAFLATLDLEGKRALLCHLMNLELFKDEVREPSPSSPCGWSKPAEDGTPTWCEGCQEYMGLSDYNRHNCPGPTIVPSHPCHYCGTGRSVEQANRSPFCEECQEKYKRGHEAIMGEEPYTGLPRATDIVDKFNANRVKQ